MTRQPNSSHWIPPMISIPEVIPRSRRLKVVEREREKLVNTILKWTFLKIFNSESHLKCLNVKNFPTIFNGWKKLGGCDIREFFQGREKKSREKKKKKGGKTCEIRLLPVFLDRCSVMKSDGVVVCGIGDIRINKIGRFLDLFEAVETILGIPPISYGKKLPRRC